MRFAHSVPSSEHRVRFIQETDRVDTSCMRWIVLVPCLLWFPVDSIASSDGCALQSGVFHVAEETRLGSMGRGEEQFLHPLSLARPPRGEGLWVVDSGNDRIQRLDHRLHYVFDFGSFAIDPSGQFEQLGPTPESFGSFLPESEGLRLEEPRDIVETQNRELYIVDRLNGRIVHTDRDGRFISSFGVREGLRSPNGIATNSLGDILVADTENDRIVWFDRDGRLLRSLGSYGWGPQQFRFPEDVAVNGKDHLVVADTGNGRLQIFDHFGALKGINQGFVRPRGISFDEDSLLWVADPGLFTVRAIDNSGRVVFDLAEAIGRPVEGAVDVVRYGERLLICDVVENRIRIFRLVRAPSSSQINNSAPQDR